MNKKPNLFNFATSELSQDAFLSWLFCWAEEQYKKSELHDCALEVLNLFMNTRLEKINKIQIYKQERHIDLVVSVDDKYLLVIEDKTCSSEHDNQLERYKTTVANWMQEEGLTLPESSIKYAYYKTGAVLTEERRNVQEAQYKLIDTSLIKSIFDRYSKCKSEIFSSYYSYLCELSQDYDSVNNLSYEAYKDLVLENSEAIYSFYKNLADEFKTDCGIWKVNSPSRHSFYTMTFGWDKWSGANVYFELDGFELMFRLTDFRGNKSQKKVAENAYLKINKLNEQNNNRCIVEKKPGRTGGDTLRLAGINESSWLTLSDGKIDIKKTALKLQKLEKMFFEHDD